ncbi:hypothetical protein Dimus_027629 [Dionaea muscipula]
MKLIRQAFGASSNGLLHPFGRPLEGWALSTNAASGDLYSVTCCMIVGWFALFFCIVTHNTKPWENHLYVAEAKRIFEAPPEDDLNSLFKQFHKLGKPYGQSGLDGMEEKLKDAATYFKMTDETEEEDFS